MASSANRLLTLLSLLQSGRRWSGEELATAMGLTPRTLRRDLERLREIGYPVSSVRGPGGYYYLNPGKVVPPVIFDNDEAVAVALGLRLAGAGQAGVDLPLGAAERAEMKLRRLLPTPLREQTDRLLDAIVINDENSVQPSPALLATIAEAVTGHKVLTFDHEGKRGRLSRTVEPIRLIHLNHRWYLYSWDRDRRDWRVFRIDRIVSSPQVGLSFTPRPLPSEDLGTLLNRQFHTQLEEPIVVDLEASVGQAASRLYRIDGVLDSLSENRCRYTAYVDSYQWMALVLTVSEIPFSVIGPEGFRSYLHHVATRLVQGAESSDATPFATAEDSSYGAPE